MTTESKKSIIDKINDSVENNEKLQELGERIGSNERLRITVIVAVCIVVSIPVFALFWFLTRYIMNAIGV